MEAGYRSPAGPFKLPRRGHFFTAQSAKKRSFFQGETHRSFPPLGALMLARKRDHNARANCRIRTHAPADLIYLRAGALYYRGGKAGGVLRHIRWMRSPLRLRPRKGGAQASGANLTLSTRYRGRLCLVASRFGHKRDTTSGRMMIPTPLPILKGPCLTLPRPVAGDVEAKLAIGRHAEIVRAYGRSFEIRRRASRGNMLKGLSPS